jgi:hypothetical protein
MAFTADGLLSKVISKNSLLMKKELAEWPGFSAGGRCAYLRCGKSVYFLSGPCGLKWNQFFGRER